MPIILTKQGNKIQIPTELLARLDVAVCEAIAKYAHHEGPEPKEYQLKEITLWEIPATPRDINPMPVEYVAFIGSEEDPPRALIDERKKKILDYLRAVDGAAVYIGKEMIGVNLRYDASEFGML